ncbi:hypothetical protein ACFPK1_24175 [Actinomycetospora rhizophila]|uniref:Uncharacterized protein n=1 Tax=Actinomycetospora rhizophila TaxID=1416876 RepID=A0ABV9ZK13_9PSEU
MELGTHVTGPTGCAGSSSPADAEQVRAGSAAALLAPARDRAVPR